MKPVTDHGPPPDRTALAREGKRSIARLATELTRLEDQIGEAFCDAVELILNCRGHVAVSGAGTSSTIAARLAHLLTVVGAPAFFLSAGDSAHGGAAAITDRDALIAISKGGESDELNGLVEVARRNGAPVIAITQDEHSTLARTSNVVLFFSVAEALDAKGYIALGSSIAAAAIGDALCFAVFSVRGFDDDAFRLIHPGGAVGKMLGTRPESV